MTFALVESAWYDATNFMLEPMLGLLACSIVRSQTEGTAEWKQPWIRRQAINGGMLTMHFIHIMYEKKTKERNELKQMNE